MRLFDYYISYNWESDFPLLYTQPEALNAGARGRAHSEVGGEPGEEWKETGDWALVGRGRILSLKILCSI